MTVVSRIANGAKSAKDAKGGEDRVFCERWC